MARNRGTELSRIMTKAGAKKSNIRGNITIQMEQRISENIMKIVNEFYNKIIARFQSFNWKYRNDIYVSLIDYELIIDFPDYLDYQDKGVNGVRRNRGSQYSFGQNKPPLEAIDKWCLEKGIQPFINQTRESMVYAIRESIWKNGISPKDFYGDLIERLRLDIISEINNTKNYDDIIVEGVVNIIYQNIN